MLQMWKHMLGIEKCKKNKIKKSKKKKKKHNLPANIPAITTYFFWLRIIFLQYWELIHKAFVHMLKMSTVFLFPLVCKKDSIQ